MYPDPNIPSVPSGDRHTFRESGKMAATMLTSDADLCMVFDAAEL